MSRHLTHLSSGSAPDENLCPDLNNSHAFPSYDSTSQNVRGASLNAYPLTTPTPYPYSMPSSSSSYPSPGGLHTSAWGVPPPAAAHPFAPQPVLCTRPGTLLDSYAPSVPDLDFRHLPAVWPVAGGAASVRTQWSSAYEQPGEVSVGVRAPAVAPGTMGPPPVPVRGRGRWQERLRGARTADGGSPARNRLAAAVGAGPDGVSPRPVVGARPSADVLQRRPAPKRPSKPWYPCDWRKYMAGWGGWPSEDSVPEASVAGAGAGADLGRGDLGFEPRIGPYEAQRHHERPPLSPWAVAGGGNAYLLGPDTEWETPVNGTYPGLRPGVPSVSEQPLVAQEGGLASGGLRGESGCLAHAGGSGEWEAAATKAQPVLEGRINKSKRGRGAGKTAGPSRASVDHARRQEQSAAEQVQQALALPGAPQQPVFRQGQPWAELVQPSGAHEQAFVDLTYSPEATEPSSGVPEHSTEQEQLQQEQVVKEQEQVPEDDDAAWDVEFLRLLTEDSPRTDEAAAEKMRDF